MAKIKPLTRQLAQDLYKVRHQFGVDILTTLNRDHAAIAEQLTAEHRAIYESEDDGPYQQAQHGPARRSKLAHPPAESSNLSPRDARLLPTYAERLYPAGAFPSASRPLPWRMGRGRSTAPQPRCGILPARAHVIPPAPAPVAPLQPLNRPKKKGGLGWLVWLIVLLLLAAAGWAIYHFYFQPQPQPVGADQAAAGAGGGKGGHHHGGADTIRVRSPPPRPRATSTSFSPASVRSHRTTRSRSRRASAAN